MNKTKKLTQGAMMLAIIGAMIAIDRFSAYWFSQVIVLIIPVIIILYSAMYSFNDGVVISVGALIISFLLANFNILYLIYVPIGIVTALAYAFALQKNLDRNRLLLIAIFVYLVGEIFATFVIYPLFGIPISTYIEEFKLFISQAQPVMGVELNQIISLIGADLSKLVTIALMIATVLMGIIEGLMIHLFSLIFLNRFKIKNLGRINLFEIKPNPIIAYIAFLGIFITPFLTKIENENLYYALFSFSMIATLILLYYGYMFVLFYGVIVLKRNIAALMFPIMIFISLFIPSAVFMLLFVLIILGFLYGSGPLRRYLERKVQQ